MNHQTRVGLVGLLLWIGGGLLGCCVPVWAWASSDNPSWKTVGERFERRFPDDLAVAGDSALFTRECPGWEPGLRLECTELWRLHGTEMKAVHQFPGAVSHMSGQGSTWFVMLSLRAPEDPQERREQEQRDGVRRYPARRYQMVRSMDDGLTWEERGDVVDTGPLLVLSANEVWILSDSVMRSADGGLTFQEVSLPGERDSINERLSLGRNGDVLLTGPSGLLRMGRDGVLKEQDALDGWNVAAAAGGYFAGDHDGVLAIRKDEPGASWIPFKRGAFRVSEVAADGEGIRVLTRPVDPSKGGTSYHVSMDGGRTWSHEDTGFLKAALSGREMGAAWNYVGQVYTYVSP